MSESGYVSSVDDVFVDVEDHPIFDCPEVIKELSTIRHQLKQAPKGSTCFCLVLEPDDEDDDPVFIEYPIVVVPEAFIAPEVVSEYKKTPAFKSLMETLAPEVAHFPEPQRTVTALTALALIAIKHGDIEISNFAFGCIATLMPKVEIFGIYTDEVISTESIRKKSIIQIALFQMRPESPTA